MATINFDPDVWSNKKVRALVKLLGTQAPMVLFRLWSHAAKHKWRDGVFWDYTERELEEAGNWKGRRGKLAAALLTTGLLELVPGPNGGQHYAIHDWTEHQGHLARIRDAARAATKAKWAKAQAKVAPSSDIANQALADAPTQQMPLTILTNNQADIHTISHVEQPIGSAHPKVTPPRFPKRQ